MQDDLNNTYDLLCCPSEIGKAWKVILTRLNNFNKSCNTMYPISHNCLNCKHRHYEEAYDYAYGMLYIYKHWCGIDKKLMNILSVDKKPMPENCTYYEYGESTCHPIPDEEKKRLGIR